MGRSGDGGLEEFKLGFRYFISLPITDCLYGRRESLRDHEDFGETNGLTFCIVTFVLFSHDNHTMRLDTLLSIRVPMSRCCRCRAFAALRQRTSEY